MLNYIPPNTRLLAHSTRGYKNSSPFSLECQSSAQKSRDCLGEDLASVIAGYVERLSLLSHPQSSIKIICWSLGCGSVMSAYNLCAQNSLPDDNARTLKERISEIIFYEPPASLVLGQEPSASTLASRESATHQNPLENFLVGAAGIYEYPLPFLQSMKSGVHFERSIFRPKDTLANDTNFRKLAEEIMDPGPMMNYIIASTPKFAEGEDYVRRALKAILEAPGVRKIKVLTTLHTVPDCIEGCGVLTAQLQDLEKDMQVTKSELCFVQGEYNHFVHVQAPEVLWTSIL
jgi:hypothetical protein